MVTKKKAQISSRKEPKQARSTELVSAILEAAIQVLMKHGAHRFTTARVADKAGVSVGSLYQYFPNKASILFRLQSDEWRQTNELLQRILEDGRKPPLRRLRTLVHAFIKTECEEAGIRMALDDAAPLYRDAPEAKAAKAASIQTFDIFLREALPKASKAKRALTGTIIRTTLSAVGKEFSETPRTPSEIESYAGALADMLCAYVERAGKASLPGKTLSCQMPELNLRALPRLDKAAGTGASRP